MSVKGQTTQNTQPSDSGWRATLTDAIQVTLGLLGRIAKATEQPAKVSFRSRQKRVVTLSLARNFSDRAALGLSPGHELYGATAGFLQKSSMKAFPPGMVVWYWPDEGMMQFMNEGRADVWVPADVSVFRWWAVGE